MATVYGRGLEGGEASNADKDASQFIRSHAASFGELCRMFRRLAKSDGGGLLGLNARKAAAGQLSGCQGSAGAFAQLRREALLRFAPRRCVTSADLCATSGDGNAGGSARPHRKLTVVISVSVPGELGIAR
ncbi:hypothetical protein [Streptomyces spinosirectus]